MLWFSVFLLLIIPFEELTMLYYDQANLPKPKNSYVCWIDIMGAKAILSRTLLAGTTFIAKLHKACLIANGQVASKVNLYPMIDGLYITCTKKDDLEIFLKKVFNFLMNDFNSATNMYRFVVKASIAFGPIIEGQDIEDEGDEGDEEVDENHVLNGRHKEALLLGMPMVQTYIGESLAPPFGIYIHESARAFTQPGSSTFTANWWVWYIEKDPNVIRLIAELRSYFDWCKNRSAAIDYPEERIAHHLKLATQYFDILK